MGLLSWMFPASSPRWSEYPEYEDPLPPTYLRTRLPIHEARTVQHFGGTIVRGSVKVEGKPNHEI